MRSIIHSRRRGMTLVELLVVVLILGLLSVAVLPNIAGTANSRRLREAARGLSSFIARSQSRSIDAREPRGLIIQPIASDPDVAIDFFFADVPAGYSGELTSSRAALQLPAGTPTSGIVRFIDANLPLPASDAPDQDSNRDSLTRARLTDKDFCFDGDAIQFGGRGPYFRFTPPNIVSMWVADNQSPRNTPWPKADGFGTPYRIRRQPTRASSGMMQLQRGAAVDLAWSCIGSRPLTTLIPAAGRAQPIVLLFDSSGKPSELVHSGGVRTTIGEPLFLLLGLSELCGNAYVPLPATASSADAETRTGANWQYADSVWLCVDNNSGVVKFGPVAPRAADVIGSQRYIRMTIGLGVSER